MIKSWIDKTATLTLQPPIFILLPLKGVLIAKDVRSNATIEKSFGQSFIGCNTVSRNGVLQSNNIRGEILDECTYTCGGDLESCMENGK